jgi:predicted glycosyltransferase
MDDAETIKKVWKNKGVYDILDTLYDEVWTYGIRDFYDPIKEYDIPEHISQKMQFTGYIPRKVPNREEVKKEKQRNIVREGQKLVVITTGGGGDGYPVMDAFLSMLESQKRPFSFASILITGPFMPRRKRTKVFKRARKLGIIAFHFYRHMEKIMAAADLVVCMGGYNTLCELMSQKTVTLLIPRETPRKEQLIRAKCFHRHNLVEYIPWDTLSPETLRQKIFHLLEHPEFYQNAIAKFQMTGHKIIRQRLQEFRNRKL